MKTTHQIYNKNSSKIKEIPDNTVNLIVTSPPYPMIEMWDEIFSRINNKIKDKLEQKKGIEAFNLMHEELNKTWRESYRILKTGGIACINIGDATRKINEFKLYSNHSEIIKQMEKIGFETLPDILWRKPSNKPNKFMGSGMLPPNAYPTLEHEYILVFRKKGKRNFSEREKKIRYQSSYFWEERNKWFSDIWTDLKGTNQNMIDNETRQRSAAFPFELSYRLINMFSIQNDMILDPFWGTGTTTLAAIASCRNSIGVEIDKKLVENFKKTIKKIKKITFNKNQQRLNNHLSFLKQKDKIFKHKSVNYDFPVTTSQEKNILFYDVENISEEKKDFFVATHKKHLFQRQKEIKDFIS